MPIRPPSTKYPAQVDTSITLPKVIDNKTPITAEVVNRLRDAILATEGELGPKPSGIYGNVRNRLDSLEKLLSNINEAAEVIINTPFFDGDLTGSLLFQNVIGIQGRPINDAPPDYNNVYQWDGYQWLTRPGVWLSTDIPEDGYVLTWVTDQYVPLPAQGGGGGSVTFSNDLFGNNVVQTVIGFQGRPFASTAPTDGYAIIWNASGSEWRPGAINGSPTGIAGGDLDGTYPNPIVAGLQGVTVDVAAPVASAVPVYSTVNTRYDIRQLTLDDIGPAFAITSFLGGSTQEVGATVNNPAFTAAYSSTPSSAQITNTEGIDSPKILITPFTSGTVTGAFNKNIVASITFTLQAVGATTKFATTAINFFARSFIGIGTAGATSATASGTTAILVGATGTLASHNLASTVVNTTTTTQSPSGQKIYFLCVHTVTPHTFKDQNGFTFAFNAPTVFNFINQNSVSLSYDLYESTNLLSTPFAITVVT